jgi:hypothetical protein
LIIAEHGIPSEEDLFGLVHRWIPGVGHLHLRRETVIARPGHAASDLQTGDLAPEAHLVDHVPEITPE